MDPELIKALLVTSEIYGKEFSETAATVLAQDLSEYSTSLVIKALSKCRRELRTFPTLADIISRIDDSRPGAEEAWAMLPKDERSSVVWTDEMAEAFGVARGLIEEDPIAARLAFKELYQKLVAEARFEKRPPRWSPSLGTDRHGQAAALNEALAKGRLSHAHVSELLPDQTPGSLKLPHLSGMSKLQALPEPEEPPTTPETAKEYLARIRKLIEKGDQG